MDLTRFTECSAAFGAERRRWPVHEQALYDRFAATPEGAAILADAARVDGVLDAWQLAAPAPGIVSRTGAIVRRARRRLATLAAALVACAGAGFAVGYAQAQGAADSLSPDLLLGPHSLSEI